jgi:hypothetical protein
VNQIRLMPSNGMTLEPSTNYKFRPSIGAVVENRSSGVREISLMYRKVSKSSLRSQSPALELGSGMSMDLRTAEPRRSGLLRLLDDALEASERYQEERNIYRGLAIHQRSVCRLSGHWALCFRWHRVYASCC